MSLPPGARITGMWCQACLFTWMLRIHVDSGPHACTTYSLLTKLSPHPQVCSADCSDWSAPTPLTQEKLSAAPVHRGRLFCVENVPYGVRQVFLKTYIFLCTSVFVSVYICVPCVYSARRGQKQASDHQTVVGTMRVLETEPGSSARAASALGCWAISPPWVSFFMSCSYLGPLPQHSAHWDEVPNHLTYFRLELSTRIKVSTANNSWRENKTEGTPLVFFKGHGAHVYLVNESSRDWLPSKDE